MHKLLIPCMSLLLLTLSPTLLAQVNQEPPTNGMSSKDYLRLMEQANERNGVQAGGGNYPGARPRPAGSLPTTTIVSPPPPPQQPPLPAKQPLFLPDTKPNKYPRAILRSSPVPSEEPTAQVPTLPVQSTPAPTATPTTVPTPSPTSTIPLDATLSPSAFIPNAPLQQPHWQPPQTQVEQYQPPYNSVQPNNIPAVPSKPITPSSSYNFGKFDGPRWLLRYAPVWVHRSGDENLTYSQSGILSPFGADTAHEIAIGTMTNPMDAYEFSFLGSLNWNRNDSANGPTSSGPLNASLVSPDPNWLTNFQNVSHLHQVQSADYRSFGFHKRWLTDEINNYRIGFQGIEYNEAFALRTEGSQGVGRFENQTQNWLLGFSGGLEHWHPVADKLAIGGMVDSGLFINLAETSILASDGISQQVQLQDDETSLSALFGAHLKARYQLSDRWTLVGGYRWWVLTGIATVDDQNIRDLHNSMALSLSSDETILFHGADACIEWNF